MQTFTGWHFAIVIGVLLVLGYFSGFFAAFMDGYRGPQPARDPNQEAQPTSSLKSWTLRGANILGVVAVIQHGIHLLLNQTEENVIRMLILVPIYWLLGGLVGGLLYLIVRSIRAVGGAARTAAPVAANVGLTIGKVGVDIVHESRKSPIEKRLAEIERLHDAGQISDEERRVARNAALTNL